MNVYRFNPWLRNLHRATTWVTRHRARDGVRHLRRSGIVTPIAGSRRRGTPGLRELLWLVIPGFLLGLLGLTGLSQRPVPLSWALLFGGLALIFAVRAWTAEAPWFPRALAFVLSLVYPVCQAIVLYG